MNDRKRILIVTTDMHVGGVTMALLSLMNTIDQKKYTVDLLLENHDGVLQNEIPSFVHVLPPARQSGKKITLKKVTSPVYVFTRMRALLHEKVLKQGFQGMQLRARAGSAFTKRLETDYDLAISFIEFWPLYYTARYVSAKHKLAWIHLNYKNSGLNEKLDQPFYAAYDRIVMVSAQCAADLQELCPKYANKVVYLPNIVSEVTIRNRANQACAWHPPKARIVLVTVSRISFIHKGLDRGIKAFDALRREGKLEGVVWLIIGGGDDEKAMRTMIKEMGRTEEIIPLGQQLNPLPYVRQCDAFILPSHYEGKPIAVTEAMIVGLPAMVTNYSSAPEQITDGFDGLIVENSDSGFMTGLEKLCDEPGLLEELKRNVSSNHYGNESDYSSYEALWHEINV